MMSRSDRFLLRLTVVGFATAFLFAASVRAESVAADAPVTTDPDALAEQGFTPLFDGVSLDGWRNPYSHGEAEVVDGEIHLRGDNKFFLVTDREYTDFRLLVDIHLPEGPANSGVLFRCHVKPGWAYGYQAECDGSPRCWSGGLYDEGRRNWIWPSTQGRSEPEFLEYEEESKAFFKTDAVRNALDRDGWNRYEILCRGDHIVIKLNGVKITDLHDDVDRTGFIGIQHHGEKGQLYRFRNLYIKEFPEDGADADADADASHGG